MADENTKSLNGLALKSRDGYTGKLFLPSTADIATLNTAQADITSIQNSISTIDPTARFIVAATEPSTADDGKIWIEVPARTSAAFYPYFASTGTQNYDFGNQYSVHLGTQVAVQDLVIRKYNANNSAGDLFPEGTYFRIDGCGINEGAYSRIYVDAAGKTYMRLISGWKQTNNSYGILGMTGVLTAEDGGAYWWDGTQAVSSVFLSSGTLQIAITTGSDTKAYDGTMLQNDVCSATFTPDTCLGDYAYDLHTTGQQLIAGSSDNTYEFSFTKPTVFGDNYKIVAETLGTLTVTPSSATIIP